MHHHELEWLAKRLFFYLKVKVTARAHMIKTWVSAISSELLILFGFCYQTWFDITLSLARVSYEKMDLLCSRSRSQQNIKMSMNVCPDDIFWPAETFTTKLDMVMHHHEPDCLSKQLYCCHQGQGHSEGSYNKKYGLPNITSELLILL